MLGAVKSPGNKGKGENEPQYHTPQADLITRREKGREKRI